MAPRKTGLGKGLDSLIPKMNSYSENRQKASPSDTNTEEDKKPQPSVKNEVNRKKNENQTAPDKTQQGSSERMVKLSLIEPNRSQPRMNFDEDALVELSDSIKQFGVLQPLLVQPKGNFYELIAGERRWRAAKMAGLKEVPVIVREFTKQESIEIALIENIQRENLNPIEEARAYQRLLNEFNLKQDEVAERVSKSRSAVTNSMRLLKLDEKIQDMVTSEMITTGHARALLALEDPEEQYRLAGRIFDENLSVRETEKIIRNIKEPKKKVIPVSYTDSRNAAIYNDMAGKMKEAIGTKVTLNDRGKGKGSIQIEYYSEDELDRIYHMIMTLRQ